MDRLESARSEADAGTRYDRLAPYYDRYITRLERRHVDRLVDDLELEPGETVLDIGCGPGTALVTAGEQVGADGTVVGLDLSAEMIDRARRRLEDRGFGDRALLINGDARNMRHVADDSVDAVVSSFTLELLSSTDRQTVLGECRRVLTPEGRLGALSLSRKDRLAVSLYDRLHRLRPDVFDCRPIDLVAALERADFEIRAVRTESLYGLPVEGVVATPP